MKYETRSRGTKKGVAGMITAVISVIIGVILITSLALTITDNTNTDATEPLENVSSDAKSLYGLYDLIWAAGGLLLIVFGLFAAVKGKK